MSEEKSFGFGFSAYKAEEPKVEEAKVEEVKAEEPKAEAPKKKKAKKEEPKPVAKKAEQVLYGAAKLRAKRGRG